MAERREQRSQAENLLKSIRCSNIVTDEDRILQMENFLNHAYDEGFRSGAAAVRELYDAANEVMLAGIVSSAGSRTDRAGEQLSLALMKFESYSKEGVGGRTRSLR